MVQHINQKQLKRETAQILRNAHVSPMGMTLLYLVIVNVLSIIDYFASGDAVALTDRGLPGIFIYILAALLTLLLGSGFTMYCMAIRRGEEADTLTLFDGFSMVGKIIALNIIIYGFTMLWMCLFILPGIIAAYRYRFAFYNLYENPDMPVMQALHLSTRQTKGYKGQLFTLDMSYVLWVLLASLPLFVEILAVSGVIALPAIPGFVWVVAAAVCQIAVAPFYLASYQCTEYAYYEIARTTSGLDPRVGDSDSAENSDSPAL